MEGGATGNGGAGALKMPEIWAESTCSHEPPTMSSEGVWSSYRQYGSSFWIGILQHPIPLLELQLFVIFFLHYLLHFLHTRLKLPWLFIHGLVGFIIGQVLRSNQNLSKLALNDESETVITTLMSIGFALFMFISGVKVDPSMMIKSGKQALTMGTLALFFPIILTTPLFEFMKRRFPYSQIGLRFFAFSQSLTPFPVIACLLTDLKILNSELGRLTSSSSLISYLISFALMAMFIFFRVSSEISVLVGFKVVVVCMAFTCSLWVFVRPLMFWIIKQTPEGKPVRESYIVFIVVLAVLSAVISDFVGLEYMFGPFILGLVIPDGPPLGSTLAERLDTVISGVVVPLFMTYGGYRITFQTGLNHIFMAGICGIVLLTVLGKLIAGVLTAWLCNIPYKDAFVISIIMSAKGIVDICLYITCNDKKQMENSFLSLLIVSVLLTGTIVQLVVSNIYDPSRKYAGYQKRNILHLERNAELRVLSCVLRQDDALAAIKLLEAYNPSKESPLSVHVLHLEELVGRATPLIIDHQLGQKSSSNSSPSGLRAQHIIDVFNYYKHQNLGSVSVQVFTAVSPFLFMHDDVCSLAFDKSASLVLLPFHRKWSAKGNLILDDTILRSINCQVLEKAPCSVGILVDRRKMCGSSSASNISMRSVFRMAMLFMGGDDDREALVLSKRMARSPLVHLSVVRLVSKEAKLEDRWERMLDAETLKEVQIRSPLNANITYLEHKVKEGPETAQIARSMENKFDLIILGRRHKIDSPFTTGLTEWSEFPELGPIGDLLASSDIQSGVSVLVVQQQQLQCD